MKSQSYIATMDYYTCLFGAKKEVHINFIENRKGDKKALLEQFDQDDSLISYSVCWTL